MLSTVVSLGLMASPVRWTAPAECPDIATAEALVDAELVALPEDDRAQLRISGVVQPRSPGYSLEVTLDGVGDPIVRTVALDDCNAAPEALALVVAIALDPQRADTDEPPTEPVPPAPVDEAAGEEPPAVVPTQPEPDEGEVEPPPPRIEPPPAPTPEPPTRAEALRPRIAIHAAGGIGLGMLPGVGGRVRGGVASVWRRARIGLSVDHQFRRRFPAVDRDDIGAELSVTTARLIGGGIVGFRRLEVPLLGVLGVGAVRGSGFGALDAQVRSVPWIDAGAHVGLQWFVLPWLGLGTHAELLVPLVRHTFVVDDTVLVTTTGSVAGAVCAGVELRFP